MVTIRDIALDVLNIIRGSNISQSEPISERQIYKWINYYRALLLRRDLDKNKMPNPDYIQELNKLTLTREFESGDMVVESPNYILSTIDIPNVLSISNGQAITYVGTIEGDEIQLSSQQRSRWQKYNKYAKNEPIAYSKNNKIYIYNDTIINYISVRGVFEDPLEVFEFNGDDPLTSKYPVPANHIPSIKEMILKLELNIQANAPTDTTNDSEHDINRPSDV